MSRKLKILYIEDCVEHYTDLLDHLKENYPNLQVQISHADTAEKAYDFLLKNKDYHGIIIDMNVPHCLPGDIAYYNLKSKMGLAGEDCLGIKVVLKIEENDTKIRKAHKVVVSSYAPVHYDKFFNQLNGPKEIIIKTIGKENSENIAQWLKTIKK